MRNLSDRELVLRYRSSRDPALFQEIYDRYSGRAFQTASRILGARHLAEDAVQTTFERALREFDGFSDRNDGASLEKWLIRICRNACLDELRRRRTRMVLQPRLQEECGPRRAAGCESVQIREALEVLSGLAERYRICYLLQIEGYSYEEIVTLTGYTSDEVKTFIRTARRNLVRVFSDAGSRQDN